MKNNYTKFIFTALILVAGLIGYSQNIQFTIEDAKNTNDGSFDYYEADVMIQTIDGQADFKLGSGQIYFNYNTAAFGMNIFANNGFEVTAVYNNGEYFLGELAGFTNFYDITTLNDNTSLRASWSFSQGVSSGAMTQLVTSTPRKLIHVKIKYVDVNEDPMVSFEDNETLVSSCRDQFYTACGPFDSPSTSLDCTNTVDAQNVNTQFLDAMFDSSGATLTNKDFELITNISLYPNPAKNILTINAKQAIENITIYNIMGQKVTSYEGLKNNKIDVSLFSKGFYILNAEINGVTESLKFLKK